MATGVSRTEPLVFGTSLVAVGALWTAANLGLLDLLATLRHTWPLALLLWGGLEVRAAGRRRAGREGR